MRLACEMPRGAQTVKASLCRATSLPDGKFGIERIAQSAVTLRSAAADCVREFLPLLEIALMLVRLDHVVRRIVNANHGIV